MKYYISDTHFGHTNVLTFDNRPFNTIEDMDAKIIENWNATIKKHDEVYVLGDMFWKNPGAADILKALKGKKFLVKGNHDRVNDDMAKQFIKVEPYMEVKDGDTRIVLSHYPIAHWNGQFHDSVHFYGHIHTTKDRAFYTHYKQYCIERGLPFRAYNVGCMMPWMDYAPQTMEHILQFGE